MGTSLILLLALAVQPAEAELRAWTAELASDDPTVREEAGRRLAAAGDAALPFLAEAQRSNDPEVAARARLILESQVWRPMSTQGAPPGTRGAVAVWTGRAMIVWGGIEPTAAGRYDPETDTWAAIARAPIAAQSPCAVWVGSEMVVWGGALKEGVANAGARYDPAADAWRPCATAGAPRPRWQHATAWTGREVFIWGGHGDSPLGVGARYDPARDSWTPIATVGAPTPRSGATAVWTGREVIVWGGTGHDGWVRDAPGRYDPVLDHWTPVSLEGAPSQGYGHSAVWTGSEMIVWGGYARDFQPCGGGRYDPETDTWRPVATDGAPEARSGDIRLFHRFHAHAFWTGREMLVWGGEAIASEAGAIRVDTGGAYDPLADAWRPISRAGAPGPRVESVAVWTGRELIVCGGDDRGARGRLADGARYRPDVEALLGGR